MSFISRIYPKTSSFPLLFPTIFPEEPSLKRGLLSLICVTTVFQAGCHSIHDYSGVGVQPKEAVLLERSYYLPKGFIYPEYTNQEMSRIFHKSTDQKLDGETAEAQMSKLVMMLCVVGDARFANRLKRESQHVQDATIRYIKSLWEVFHMRYPKTQALQRPIKQNV